mgnify:CR=1 FL=1
MKAARGTQRNQAELASCRLAQRFVKHFVIEEDQELDKTDSYSVDLQSLS